MDKLTALKSKLKDLKKALAKQGKFMLLIEIALVLLVMVVALNYLFYSSDARISQKNTIKTWDYIYTNNAKETFSGKMNAANSLNPMSVEKVGSYLHFKTKIERAETDRTLVLKTDHSPVKISLNGKEIYNNYYGTNEYVGNNYNAVVIPASTAADIQISAGLPFSANVEAYLVEGSAHPSYNVNGGVIFALIVLFAGLVSLLIGLFLRVIKRKKIRFLGIFITLIAFGTTALMNSLTRCTYFVNLPNYYNITLALENLCLLVILFFCMKITKIKNKIIPALMILDVLLVIASCIPTNLLLFKAVLITSTVVALAICVILVAISRTLLDRRIQYAKSMFLMLLFAALYNGLSDVMMGIERYRNSFAFCKSVGLFVMVCYLVFVQTVKIFAYNNVEDIQNQITLHHSYVDKVTELVRNALGCDSMQLLCRVICDGVDDLCKEMGKVSSENGLIVSAMVKENGQYTETYTNSVPGAVNPFMIENRCLLEEKFCIYNETFFDMVLADENDFRLILHFENIEAGLDKFFISIMNTIYSCIRLIHARLVNGSDDCDMQIFVDLAKKCEISTGNNTEHLDSVCFYTKSFMEAMDYPESVCETVSKAAMLHDIGKIAIPLEISTKSSLLSEDERAIMKQHTAFGHAVLSVFDSEFLQIASVIARDHHERYDGLGYNGTAGEEIDKFARIVSVADVMDALMAKRSYKEPWPLEKVIDYVETNSGTMFDPEVVAAMHKCLDIIKARITEDR